MPAPLDGLACGGVWAPVLLRELDALLAAFELARGECDVRPGCLHDHTWL